MTGFIGNTTHAEEYQQETPQSPQQQETNTHQLLTGCHNIHVYKPIFIHVRKRQTIVEKIVESDTIVEKNYRGNYNH